MFLLAREPGCPQSRACLTEEVYLQEYRKFAEAEVSLRRFITDVYNAMPWHSRLGYLSPGEFEAQVASVQDEVGGSAE